MKTTEAPGAFAAEIGDPLSLVLALKFICILQSYGICKTLVLILVHILNELKSKSPEMGPKHQYPLKFQRGFQSAAMVETVAAFKSPGRLVKTLGSNPRVSDLHKMR